MKLLFEQCLDCGNGMFCYEQGFKSCLKIEAAANGLGIPYKPKDLSWAEHIPFGVYMGLKHLINAKHSMSVNPDMPEMKYPRIDFAKKLATETALTFEDASLLVAEIGIHGNIKDAMKCYNDNGLIALGFYLAGRKTLLRNGVD